RTEMSSTHYRPNLLNLQALGDADDYEALRAILCAFSHRSDGLCRPVSFVAIQHELRRRNRDPLISRGLKELAFIRDVETVGQGFWLPVPAYLVSLSAASLVVSALPNQELARQYGIEPHGLGVSRLISDRSNSARSLPESPLCDWTEAPISTLEW